jgi:hypothetical protein
MHIGCSDHLFYSTTGLEDLMIDLYEADLGGARYVQMLKSCSVHTPLHPQGTSTTGSPLASRDPSVSADRF